MEASGEGISTFLSVSEVSGDAAVQVLVADYAAVDSAGKINIIGGGLNSIGYVPNMGQTAPFAVVVRISVPPKHYNAECSVEILLEDSAGNAVQLPGPTGEAQVVRVGQAVRFEEPILPGISVPRHVLRSRQQWVLAFNTGLPLTLGQRYVWRVKIDTETREDWTEEVFVPGQAAGPIFG
jgi:hypothetical protein